MARTRDPRPNSDNEEHQLAARVTRAQNERVYEESELNAAESLMGLNVSPTTSHPAGPRSASTSISSNSTPPYLQHTLPGSNHETAQPHMSSNTASNTSTRTRRRTRGNPDGPPVQANGDAALIDSIVTSTRSDEEADEVQRGIIQLDSNIHSNTESSRQNDGSADSVHGVTLRRQSSRSENEQTEPRDHECVPMPFGRRRGKRKRSESTSVTSVSRDRMETAGEVDGEQALHDDLTYQAQPDNPAPSLAEKTGQQMQTRVSGPANPHGEMSVNGSNALKSRPRNFDRVVFGQYMMRTWYYSPYPISNVEDDNASASAGPSRHTTALSGVRGRVSKGGSTRNRARPQNAENGQSHGGDSMLWVCDKCFKYMQDGAMYELHSQRNCDKMHPPGRKVYERGAHMIYEIDGAKDKLYCQNLSLFGKLFIDIKTLFYDCENFMFYVLTDGDRQQDHVIGFFSKEKVSYDDYNLACIITFPPWQRKRFGVLMIEFSYYLSRKEGKLGTPERPLSELGLRTYLTFWTGQLVQFFRRILSVQPFSDIPRDQQWPVHDDLIRLVENQTPDRDSSKKRKKNGKISYDHAARTEIWDFGIENDYNTRDVIAATNGANDTLYKRMRWMRSSSNEDGSVTTHVFARCTLQDMAVATGIRTEDIAFTLHECGLLQRFQSLDRDGTEEIIMVSREMVEDVARQFNVKNKMCMELKYCLI